MKDSHNHIEWGRECQGLTYVDRLHASKCRRVDESPVRVHEDSCGGARGGCRGRRSFDGRGRGGAQVPGNHIRGHGEDRVAVPLCLVLQLLLLGMRVAEGQSPVADDVVAGQGLQVVGVGVVVVVVVQLDRVVHQNGGSVYRGRHCLGSLLRVQMVAIYWLPRGTRGLAGGGGGGGAVGGGRAGGRGRGRGRGGRRGSWRLLRSCRGGDWRILGQIRSVNDEILRKRCGVDVVQDTATAGAVGRPVAVRLKICGVRYPLVVLVLGSVRRGEGLHFPHLLLSDVVMVVLRRRERKINWLLICVSKRNGIK